MSFGISQFQDKFHVLDLHSDLFICVKGIQDYTVLVVQYKYGTKDYSPSFDHFENREGGHIQLKPLPLNL